jgi:hypothetical protein
MDWNLVSDKYDGVANDKINELFFVSFRFGRLE